MAHLSRRWHDEIILYLGRELKVGFTPPPDYWGLPVPLPSAKDVTRAIDDFIEDYMEDLDLLAERYPAAILSSDDDTQIRYVTWDARSILGRTPTPSESASISRALRELTEQTPAPVSRRRRPGEKRKKLVRLTALGKQRYRQLLLGDVLRSRLMRMAGRTR